MLPACRPTSEIACASPSLSLSLPPRACVRHPRPLPHNSKGKCPNVYNCQVTKVSTAIQAAECSHNTRTHNKQTFAVFVQDHQYDGNTATRTALLGVHVRRTHQGRNEEKQGLLDVLLEWQRYGRRRRHWLHQGPQHGQVWLRELQDGKFIAGKTDCK
ncbi:hypothetical protein GQ600_19912 [Phytophthora cactorum]|nr:hypothetical protein GQ600_19912 [Phytophthora cactorum]